MAQYKLKQFTRTRQQLHELENSEVTPPGKLLVPLIRNMRHINAVLSDYDEAINRVIKELGEPSQRGWVIPQDNTDAQRRFYEERDAILESEVDVDIHPLALSRFIEAMRDKKGFEVSLSALIHLDYLIEIDVDEWHDDPDIDDV